jgi:hypothetical protein
MPARKIFFCLQSEIDEWMDGEGVHTLMMHLLAPTLPVHRYPLDLLGK